MVVVAKMMVITNLKEKLPVKDMDTILQPFADADEVSGWARSGIADSIQAGIVSGRSNTELAPKAYVTRAEVASIVRRLLQKSELI
ncbi:Endo-1,4-beta-xylanase A precursor [compost metagenome]